MVENLITLKIKYFAEEEKLTDICTLINQYNSLLRFTYNRVCENSRICTKEITEKQKMLNNITLDSHFKNSAFYDARAIYKANGNKVIFGGKSNFIKRSKKLISKEEFKEKCLRPLFSVAEADKKANRKFQILNNNQILFKPDRNLHIILNLVGVGKNYQNILKKLIILQNNCQIAITYKLSKDYIYLTFDNSKLKQNEYKIKQNRVLAIDMNPNYLGYSVVDWENETDYKIISCGVFDIKSLNDKEANLKGVVSNSSERLYFKNKRNHEIIQIAYDLSKICKHFKCEICSIEDLNIQPTDTQKGKSLNKLVNNQWNRNKFENVLSKIINCSSTRLVKIHPEYSSILGNLIYRKEQLPDMVLSSIEIGRRGYEFYNQYLINRKEQKKEYNLSNF